MAHNTAWTFQDSKEVSRLGKKKAAWCVGWYEPDGSKRQSSCGAGAEGKKAAFRLAKKIEAQLVAGTYLSNHDSPWKEFRTDYEETILASMADENARCFRTALDHFERLAKPKTIATVSSKTIDKYIGNRLKERGRRKGSKVSPATVNKELRCIKAVLSIAVEWGLLKLMPNFRKKWQREPEKLPRFIPQEHFEAIYDNCHVSQSPAGLPYSAADWWRGLLATAYLTGWRIGELLSLRWEDVDIEAGTALTRHSDNKGKKSDKIFLHPTIVEHISKLRSFEDEVFPWRRNRRQLYDEFAKIQIAAGIHLPCIDANDPRHGECTSSCHRYGFHDERRAFATENAANLSAVELQAQMRHSAFSTTQRYINMAERTRTNQTERLFVPDVLKRPS